MKELAISLWVFSAASHIAVDEFDNKPYYLNATDDRKSSEESHSSSDETQQGLKFHLFVPLNFVKGCCVEVDPN